MEDREILCVLMEDKGTVICGSPPPQAVGLVEETVGLNICSGISEPRNELTIFLCPICISTHYFCVSVKKLNKKKRLPPRGKQDFTMMNGQMNLTL